MPLTTPIPRNKKALPSPSMCPLSKLHKTSYKQPKMWAKVKINALMPWLQPMLHGRVIKQPNKCNNLLQAAVRDKVKTTIKAPVSVCPSPTANRKVVTSKKDITPKRQQVKLSAKGKPHLRQQEVGSSPISILQVPMSSAMQVLPSLPTTISDSNLPNRTAASKAKTKAVVGMQA
ncbi:Uncharacterised protein [Neisseria meningitidis]|nr:Uncharacterised protein [Neisseria meningitidis]CWR16328.1 Uncharacterised protein [Neisseria meningitidis]